MERFLVPLGLLAIAALYMFYQQWVYRDKDDKGPELTGQATVTSKRVAQGRYVGKAPSRWNYLMTFTLSDGEQIELYTSEATFGELQEGQTGQLTWQGKRFYSFDPDESGGDIS